MVLRPYKTQFGFTFPKLRKKVGVGGGEGEVVIHQKFQFFCLSADFDEI